MSSPTTSRWTRLAPLFALAAAAACTAVAGDHESSGVSAAALTGPTAPPRRLPIMPTPDAIGSIKRPDTPNPLLQYYGGHVLSNVVIYEVFWGPNVAAATQAFAPPFYTAIAPSAYFDWLEEYDSIGVNGQDGQPGSNQHIGRGKFGKATTITPINTSTTLAETDIGTEISEQIAAGHLPMPDVDAAGIINAIYMIDFPPGFSYSLLGQTTGFCAYHWSVAIGGKNVPIGVHPDIADWLGGQCNMYAIGEIHSHELIEAVTDTEAAPAFATGMFARPGAWMDTNPGTGEIGDICVYMNDFKGGMIAGQTVQKVWSNQAGACVVTFPVCGGANVMPNCHNCTKFDDGVECIGMTPVCETKTANTHYGQCVACVDSTTCKGTTPICDTTNDTCRGCKVNSECPAMKPVCITGEAGAMAGQCVQCDASNMTACTGMTPKCDTTTDTCVGCLKNSDCPMTTPICDSKTQQCRACTADADCAAPTPACDTSSDGTMGQCVACTSDATCAPGTCNTTSHTCQAPVVINDAGDNGGNLANGGTSSASCGCRTVGSGTTGAGALGALALALLAATRRRRARA